MASVKLCTMRCAFRIFAVLIVSVCAPAKKPPELQVLQITARRTQGDINLDGRVRNTGTKPIQGLTLVFDFMAPGKLVITTQKTSIDEETLEPGKEAAFHAVLVDPVRAVQYQISAIDEGERDLRVENTGPFPIE